MNKVFFQHYMKTEPENTKDKYIFLVSDQDMAIAIINAGYKAIALIQEDNFYSVESFIDYLAEIAFSGTCRTDYIYIPACQTKKANDTLRDYLKAEYLHYHLGWQLFKGKDYLAKFDKEKELKAILDNFVERFEGKEKESNLDLAQFHHTNKEGTPTAAFDFAIFEHIKMNYSIFVCGFPYLYENGVYVPDYKGTRIKNIIKKYLYPQFIKSRIINQIYTLIVEADELQKEFDTLNNFPAHWVNFKDCFLDLKTLQEKPHDPKYLAINQLPFSYKEVRAAGQGAEIEKFFSFIFTAPDDRQMLLEFAGLCLTKDTSQQKFLVLCGVGGTGKSVLIRMIETALGSVNVSNVSMQELSRRFSTSLLTGKLLNSCADLSVEALEDSSTVKKLLGEDSIMSERKGENAFMFRNYSKLLFSTNMLPLITSERTNGFFRRLLILNMDKQPEKPDTELFSRLEKEIPYFIRLSIEAAHKMYQRGIITISENSKQAVMQMRKDSDVVESWLNDCCTLGKDLRVERVEAYRNFEKYCEDEERQPLTRHSFFKALRTKNLAEVRGKTERFFVGVSVGKVTVKSDGFIEVTPEQLAELPFQ